MNDSGAPSFVKDNVNTDLAELVYNEDPTGMRKYMVQRSFYPFPSKTPDEIMYLLTLSYTTEFDKVFYANFEKVFAEIEREDKGFYFRDFNTQWELIGKKVNGIIDELKKTGIDSFSASADLTGSANDTGIGRFGKKKPAAKKETAPSTASQ